MKLHAERSSSGPHPTRSRAVAESARFPRSTGRGSKTRLPKLIRAIFVTLALLQGAGALSAQDSAVTTIRVPNGGIQPQVETDSRGRVHMIYFTGDPLRGDVYYVRSDDGGSTFTAPLRVNSQAQSAIAIGTVRGPHLALGKGDRPHVAWMGSDRAQPKARGKAVPMLYARLNDAGDGFEPQRNVIREHPGLDGGASIAADPAGNVYIAWHAPDGGNGEADRRVWIARSRDNGKTFDAEMPAVSLQTGACGCCGMNIVASRKGQVYVLYRSAKEMVNRDMYLLASKDQGRTFEVLSTDPLKIGICVMSTAGFAPAGDGVVAAWETRDQIRLMRVRPDDPAAAEIISPPGHGGNRKHPCVASNARGEFIVAWAENTGWNKGGSVAWQVFDNQGRPEAGRSGRMEGLPVWDAPAAFAASDGSFRIVF